METRPIKMSICRSIGAFICRNKFGWGLGEFALQEFKERHIPQNDLQLIQGSDNI